MGLLCGLGFAAILLETPPMDSKSWHVQGDVLEVLTLFQFGQFSFRKDNFDRRQPTACNKVGDSNVEDRGSEEAYKDDSDQLSSYAIRMTLAVAQRFECLSLNHPLIKILDVLIHKCQIARFRL